MSKRVIGLALYFLVGFFCAEAQELKDTSQQLRIWYQEAQSYMENFQFDPALERLTRCYHYAPKAPDYLLKMAYCHQQLGRYNDAKLYYRKSLEYRRTPEYLFHLGHASDRYYKDKKIALRLYEEYLATSHTKYRKFTNQRVDQLREHLHFTQGN
jgi:tetratricopeptide (TPR) repeat protein